VNQTVQIQVTEKLTYQRVLTAGDRQIAVVVSSEPDSAIVISTQHKSQGSAVVGVPGNLGADLMTSLASAYTSATQGSEASFQVAGLHIASVKMNDEFQLLLRGGEAAFPLALPLAHCLILSAQVCINDAVGEYRRQVSQIEQQITHVTTMHEPAYEDLPDIPGDDA